MPEYDTIDDATTEALFGDLPAKEWLAGYTMQAKTEEILFDIVATEFCRGMLAMWLIQWRQESEREYRKLLS